MTGPSKHYPAVRARDRVRACCAVCMADNAEVCLGNRRRGVCPVDEAFDALHAKLLPRAVAPTQTRLTE